MEDVLLGRAQHGPHGPHLLAVGGDHRDARVEHLIGDRQSLIHRAHDTERSGSASNCGHQAQVRMMLESRRDRPLDLPERRSRGVGSLSERTPERVCHEAVGLLAQRKRRRPRRLRTRHRRPRRRIRSGARALHRPRTRRAAAQGPRRAAASGETRGRRPSRPSGHGRARPTLRPVVGRSEGAGGLLVEQ